MQRTKAAAARPRWRRAVPVLAAAFAVTLAVAVPLLLLSRGGEGGPVGTTAPTTSPTISVPPTATTSTTTTSGTAPTTTATTSPSLPVVPPCPVPAALPAELAGNELAERLHASVTALGTAVNGLPGAVAEVDDFAAGWTEREPAVAAVTAVRDAAWAVYDDVVAILHDLGATGDGPFVYPPEWSVLPLWVSHLEEMALGRNVALEQALGALDGARSRAAAFGQLSGGGPYASICGVARTKVDLAEAALAAWATEVAP